MFGMNFLYRPIDEGCRRIIMIMCVIGLIISFLILLPLAIISENTSSRQRAHAATATHIARETYSTAEDNYYATIDAHKPTETVEVDQFLRLVEQQHPLVEECRNLYGNEGEPTLHGPVIPWLISDNQSSESTIEMDVLYGIPHDMIATPKDREISVIIIEADYILLAGHYLPDSVISGRGIDAYKSVVNLCVTYWPEKVVAGVGKVEVYPPDKLEGPFNPFPDYGNVLTRAESSRSSLEEGFIPLWEDPVAVWISRLPNYP
jgi:hypothetical protein